MSKFPSVIKIIKEEKTDSRTVPVWLNRCAHVCRICGDTCAFKKQHADAHCCPDGHEWVTGKANKK